MSNSKSTVNGHVYEVAADSGLGVQISSYVRRCVKCNEAIRDFLLSIEQKYSFPVPVTDSTAYCLSDDCDAGGLMAIVVGKKDFLMADANQHGYVIWDTMPSPDNEDELYMFPRIESTTHYIKYGKAVRLFNLQDPDWEFQPPTKQEKDKGLKLHAVIYDEVRTRISKTDRDALTSKPGTTPAASVRLALGRQFTLHTESLPDCPERAGDVLTRNFRDAVALYKEWMSLPCVPANSLARILRLKSNSSNGRTEADQCFCEWRYDKQHNRYLIHTGLFSSIEDMKKTDDPSALSMFGQQ